MEPGVVVVVVVVVVVGGVKVPLFVGAILKLRMKRT